MLLDFFRKKKKEVKAPEPYSYFGNRPAHAFNAACYAPFTSLYFGHRGKVVACCQNRDYVLGNYPAQSISEIWNGTQAAALREALKQDRFNLGCQHCELRVLSRNEKGLMATFYDEHPINENGFPSSMEFELNNTCNLECVMCNGDFSSLIRTKREKRDPLPQVYDRAFVEQLKPFIPHLKNMSFFGGEPFLIDIYADIWEEVIKLGANPTVFVQTNGTVLSNRVKNILEQLNFNIGVSVDSIEPENYARIRVNGRLDETLKNVEWFKAYTRKKNTIFSISVCPMQNNWHELVNIVAFADSVGAKTYIHQVISASRHIPLSALSAHELTNIYHTIKQQIETSTVFVGFTKHNQNVLTDFLNDLQFYINSKQTKPVKEFASLFDFYEVLEAKLQQNAYGHSAEDIMQKVREAMQGLETNEAVVRNAAYVDFENELSWKSLVEHLAESSVKQIRYEAETY